MAIGLLVAALGESGVIEITSRMPELARRHCGAIRANVPLRAQFRFDDGVLFWRFGPYAEGVWTIVFAEGAQAFRVPANDAFILGAVPELTVRIRYDSPEGWTTYSEPIRLTLAS